MDVPRIIVKDLVLIGGGHAHVHTIKMLGMSPIPGVSVTLITKDVESPYSGMIPGFVAGHYKREECHVDLVKLCSFGGVNMIHAEACKLDVDQKMIYCKDGRPPIRYDVLSIDVGIAPKPLPQIFKQDKVNITPVKPIDGFASRWEVILSRVLAVKDDSVVRVAIVGGGAGGVELCFAMHFRLQKEMAAIGKDPCQLHISIYNRGKTLMSQHNRQVQGIISRIALERGVTIQLNVEVTMVETVGEEDYLISTDGRRFPFDEAVWCTEAAAQSWVKESGLETTADGFICVTPDLESLNTPGVFACGDVAHLTDNPRPKAGVFAVRAGPPLTLNLRNKLLNRPLVPWVPQDQFLGIISTGNAYAIASKGPLGIEGEFLWALKDKIDKKWMGGYTDLPDKEEMMVEMKRLKKLKLKYNSKNFKNGKNGNLVIGNGGQITGIEGQQEGGGKGREGGEGGVGGGNNGEDNEEEEEEEVSEVARAMGRETIDMLSQAKMRCGGCGSKVGASVLSNALKKVKMLLHSREEVIAGIGGKSGDDAALLTPPLPPHYMIQTIDYFRSFVSDPYLFGQIAANHALSDIYAMNGDPVSALALVVLPYGPEEKVENHLVQMLAGCLYVLKREGCSLVGGHTSEGAEGAMGLSVSGVGHPDKVFYKGLRGGRGSIGNGGSSVDSGDSSEVGNGVERVEGRVEKSGVGASGSSGRCGHMGHVLVLTKAIGTGTIMAAHMRAKAKGPWVKSAFDSMVQSNREAAQILSTYRCSACTDITGFGLMGHLLEMIKFEDDSEESDDNDDSGNNGNTENDSNNNGSSNSNSNNSNNGVYRKESIAVELSLSSIPTLLGATDCIRDGVFSSLHPQNTRCSRAVGNIELGRKYNSYPLLYDPQTSGGLLAAVPAEAAEGLLAALRASGYDSAAVIGRVVEREVEDVLVVLSD